MEEYLNYNTASVAGYLLVGIIGVAYILQMWWNRKWKADDYILPPGSMGYCFIGESLHLVADVSV